MTPINLTDEVIPIMVAGHHHLRHHPIDAILISRAYHDRGSTVAVAMCSDRGIHVKRMLVLIGG
jgi:hypothetical protein